jgi:phosphoribosyl-ATP pyrophosphohydrolase
MDGETHCWRISIPALIARYRQDHSKTISPATVKRYIARLETDGITAVIRKVHDEGHETITRFISGRSCGTVR